MKKYFITDSNDELVFGDVAHVCFVLNTEDGKHTFESDVKFSPETLDMFLDMDIVEERECEEEEEEVNTPIHFNDDDYCPLDCFEEALDDLHNELEELKNIHLDTLKNLQRLVEILMDEKEEEKSTETSSKKKKK